MNISNTSLHRGGAPSWRDYPAGIDGHNSITTACKALSDCLSGLGEFLFSDEIDLRVVDIRSDNGRTPLYIANEDFH